MEYINEISDLNQQEQTLFYNELSLKKYDFTIIFIICLFFGTIGIHKFLLGENFKGLMYLLFFWTFIPTILAFINLFTLNKQVKVKNDILAREIIARIKNNRSKNM